MPKVVDKDEKREQIALSCMDLVFDVGVRNLTVAQVAKAAGIGKGTVYEYFASKDEIVFEIINIHIQKHHDRFLEDIKNVKSTKEKVDRFFKFATDESEENQKDLNGYKEYLSVVFSDDDSAMMDFNATCTDFFKDQLIVMFREGIKKGELKPCAMDFVDGLMAFEKGLVMMRMSEKEYDAKSICKKFLDSLFDLIEVKEV